jgi:hypothetical protein
MVLIKLVLGLILIGFTALLVLISSADPKDLKKVVKDKFKKAA